MPHNKSFETIAIHGGEGERRLGEPVTPAPVLSTTYYTHPDAVGFSSEDLKSDTPHFYSRWSNPTLDLLERRLAELEGGEAAVSFASGMAAITALFHQHLAAGDHLVLSDVCYAGVAEYAHHALPRMGIAVSHVDTSDPANVAAAIEQVRPYAVDVSGGVEQGKGIKDHGKIRAFMQAVRNSDGVM